MRMKQDNRVLSYPTLTFQYT